MTKKRIGIIGFLILLVAAGCQPKAAAPEPLIQTPYLTSAGTPEAALTETPLAEPTEVHGKLLIADNFASTSPLCLPASIASAFISNCSQNTLAISTAEDRRKVDILTFSELPLAAESFSLQVETLTTGAQKAKSDQNQYGVYFIDESGQKHALRLTAQYFNFETWSKNEEGRVEDKTNLTFSPLIHSAGQSNILRLDCSASGCDFFANGGLAGRSAQGMTGKITAVGLFAASEWDQQFGQVQFKDLQIHELTADQLIFQPFSLEDSLGIGSETFTGMGLSGAFNRYETDGFHFSPVIPYGYYGVKAGPGLGDMSTSVTVKMEITPGVSGSRYAGLVCRSSQEGMLMAVIRADGTYSVFRDTPRQHFALLAQKASDAILPGLAENKLRLDCIGSQIDFYINDKQVETLDRYALWAALWPRGSFHQGRRRA